MNFRCERLEAESAGRRLSIAHLQLGGRICAIGHDRQTAQTGVNSRNSPRRLPTVSVCCSDGPVALPPGRAKDCTTPAPTGSPTAANTILMITAVSLSEVRRPTAGVCYPS